MQRIGNTVRRLAKRSDARQTTFYPQLAEKNQDRWGLMMAAIEAAEEFAGRKLRGDTRAKLCRVLRFVQEHDKGKGCNAYVDTMVNFLANFDDGRQPIAKRTVQKLLALGRELLLIRSVVRPGSWCNRFDEEFATWLRDGQNVRDTPETCATKGSNVRDVAHVRRDVAHSVRDQTIRNSFQDKETNPETDAGSYEPMNWRPPTEGVT